MKKFNKVKFLASLAAICILFTSFPAVNILNASNNDEDFATQEQLDELEELRRRAEELAAQQAQLETEMENVRGDINALTTQSSELSLELDELYAEDVILQEDYERLTAELEAAKTAMEAAVADYDAAAEKVDLRQEDFEDRMVAMYKRGNKSTLEILLESDGLTGFFTNLKLVKVVAEADNKALEELTEARAEAETMKLRAEEYKEMYDQFVEDKAEEISILAQGISSTETDLSTVESDILNRSSDLSNLQSNSANVGSQQSNVQSEANRIQGEIQAQAEATRAAWAEATRRAEATRAAEASRAAEATRAAQAEATRAAQAAAIARGDYSSVPPSSYGLVFPAPGNANKVTSHFGNRLHPILGYYRLHAGIDFGGNAGDPIVSALDGVVEHVSNPAPGATYGAYWQSAGNYIIVNHGNGMKTVYMHLKTIEVSVGQRVSRGQRIGGMGSTGGSTGVHLHFEIRIPGHPNAANSEGAVNPYSYLFG